MKVYVVTQIAHDGEIIKAIFANYDKAQELRNRLDREEGIDGRGLRWCFVNEHEVIS
jgi:hypothetical protein